LPILKALPFLALFVATHARAETLRADQFIGTYAPVATIAGECPSAQLTIAAVRLGGGCGKEAQLEILSDNGSLGRQLVALNCGAQQTALYNDGLYMGSGIKQLVGYGSTEQTLLGNRLTASAERKFYPLAFNLPNYFAPLSTEARESYVLTLEGDTLTGKVTQFDRAVPALNRAAECVFKKVN